MTQTIIVTYFLTTHLPSKEFIFAEYWRLFNGLLTKHDISSLLSIYLA